MMELIFYNPIKNEFYLRLIDRQYSGDPSIDLAIKTLIIFNMKESFIDSGYFYIGEI